MLAGRCAGASMSPAGRRLVRSSCPKFRSPRNPASVNRPPVRLPEDRWLGGPLHWSELTKKNGQPRGPAVKSRDSETQ